jgi:hypothetical protein
VSINKKGFRLIVDQVKYVWLLDSMLQKHEKEMSAVILGPNSLKQCTAQN